MLLGWVNKVQWCEIGYRQDHYRQRLEMRALRLGRRTRRTTRSPRRQASQVKRWAPFRELEPLQGAVVLRLRVAGPLDH